MQVTKQIDPPNRESKTLVEKPLIFWGVPAFFMMVYTAQAWFFLERLGDITAPLMLIWALFIVFPITRLKMIHHFPAYLFSAGILCFAILEIVWAILNQILQIDPTGSQIMTAFYLLTNLCFLVAVILFARKNYQRWPTVQFVLNMVTVSLIALGVVSYLFFEREFTFDFEHIIALVYLIIDTISLAILLAMVISALAQKNDSGHWLAMVALIQFYAADYLYVILILNDHYVPNGLADWLYLASMLLLANGLRITLGHLEADISNAASPSLSHAKSISLVIMILSLPVMALIIRGIRAIELLYFAAILIIYLLASLGNQTRLSLEKLLAERTEHNDNLQKRILDRTRQLQDLNDELDHALRHDALTGLYSRIYFLSLIDREILKAHPAKPVYLAIVDLVRFRAINDLYSQETGDQVLQEIALRLSHFQEDPNTLAARLGGDEFALLCMCSPDQQVIRGKLDQLQTLLEAPIEVGPFTLHIGIRIGIAAYPENASDRTDLLKCAKTAVEQAKDKKSSAYSFYSQSTHVAVRRRNDVEMALRTAEIAREFSLYFQPQFTADGKVLIGLEALMRWNSPLLGFVSPAEFIPAAEETGEILRLGLFVMQEAMQQITTWNTRYGLNLHMGVNISPLQLENGDFQARVQEAIIHTGVDPDWLVFEITEGLALLAPETCSDIFSELKKLGIAIAIDDFGTGYSTYAYLKQFNVDYLKIDKKLIDTLSTDARDAEVIQGMIAMARALRIKTVAEGVEETEQANLLVQLGCDAIQGYLYGRPMPAAETEHFLSQLGHAFGGGNQNG